MKRFMALFVFGIGAVSAQSTTAQDETPAHQTLRARKEAVEAQAARAREEYSALLNQHLLALFGKNYKQHIQQITPRVLATPGFERELAALQRAETIERELASATARADHVDECTRIYNETIDARQSDLTTRQAGQIAACKSLDLYPFAAAIV
jgi:phosphoenolpyruvate-protein kinase (PTS system EI component)